MRFWSEGLGDRELVMGMDRAHLNRKGEILSLTGIVDSPAPWEYEVKMGFDDWQAILKTAVRPEACDFIARRSDFRALFGIVVSLVCFVVFLVAWRLVRVAGLAPAAPTLRVGQEPSAAGNQPAGA